jgi:hypothetical protein
MASNNEELSVLYRQISIMEMIERVKSGGIIWSQITPYQYKSEFAMGSDYWDIYITKMPSSSIVTVDFVKNLRPLYSINSIAEPSIIDLYNDVVGDEDFCKDKALLRDIQTAEGCGPRTYVVEIAPAGLKGNNAARVIHRVIPQDPIPSGMFVNGGFESHNNIMNIHPTGGLRASGGFDSHNNISNIYPTGGLIAKINVARVSGRYTMTVSAAGALLSGEGLPAYAIPIDPAGVLAAGAAIRGGFYAPSIASAGLWATGTGYPITEIGSGGVVVDGTGERLGFFGAGTAEDTEYYTVTTTGRGAKIGKPAANIRVFEASRGNVGRGSGVSVGLSSGLPDGPQMVVVFGLVHSNFGVGNFTFQWDLTPMTMAYGNGQVDNSSLVGGQVCINIGYMLIDRGTSNPSHQVDLNCSSDESVCWSIFSITGLANNEFEFAARSGNLGANPLTNNTISASEVAVLGALYTASQRTTNWGLRWVSTPQIGGDADVGYIRWVGDAYDILGKTPSVPNINITMSPGTNWEANMAVFS